MYSEMLLDAAHRPDHKKIPAKNVVKEKIANPMCGDDLEVGLTLNDGAIEGAWWQGRGCLVCCGTAEILCEHICTKKVVAVKKIKASEVYKLIGFRPTPSRETCALLSFQAVQKILGE